MPDENTVLDLVLALRNNAWQEYFDPQSVARGEQFARQGRARFESIKQAGETYFLDGIVNGNSDVYTVHALVQAFDDDVFGLFTSCSCPVGHNCKHGVALLQALVDDTAPASARDGKNADVGTSEQRWQHWLESIKPPMEREASTVDDERRLALLVHVETRVRSSQLAVTPVWLRPSRARNSRNFWVDPIPVVQAGARLQPAPPGGWADIQEEALQLLMQNAQRRSVYRQTGDRCSVETALQQRALTRLLEDEKPPLLFYEKQSGQALTPAFGRHIEMTWQLGNDGLQHPMAMLDGNVIDHNETALINIADTLWCLDLAQGLIGPLEGHARLFTQLDKAPGLAPEHTDWLAGQLQSMPDPPAQLKVPTTPKERRVEVPPVLVMQMGVLDVAAPRPGEPDWPLGTGIIRLRYADIDVAPDNSTEASLHHEGELMRIIRDPEAEKALFRQLPSGMAPLFSLLEQAGLAHLMEDETFDPATMMLLRGDALPDTLEDWPECLAAPNEWWPMIGQLRQLGVEIRFEEDFPPEPVYSTPDAWYGELEEGAGGWFKLSLDIELEGQRVNLLPLLGQLLDNPDFPLEPEPDESTDAVWDIALDDNHYVQLPRTRLRELMAPIMDWLQDDPHQEVVNLPVTQASQLESLGRHYGWQGVENVQALAETLRDLPETLPAPEGFSGTLRPYQAEGLAWLRFLATLNTGGILADDMGLGKTIQVLAHLLEERQRGNLKHPVLIVATTSLVGNWLAEIERFTPSLSVLALTGSKAKRTKRLEQLGTTDIAITTYPLLVRDIETLAQQPFSLAIFDEAQAIKNPTAQAAKAVRALNAKRRLAMTGTPLENHLGELWAEIDAVAPGFLGGQQWFGQHYRRPIEQHGDGDARARLTRRIQPLLLRRTKEQVLTDLPDKTDIQRSVELVGKQRELYESLRLAQHERVRQSIEQRGLAQSGIVMLDALLKLRQACCDPRLVKLDSAQRIQRSAKLDLLRELLPALIDEQRHILVFSQFTEMLALIAEALDHDQIPYLTLTGQTPADQRTESVAQFQRGDIPVFLISLKAGGVGLNLTQADTVIHYDPWWNPAVEAQATGRAHRIGQQNPVFVYKLVASGTVEERIMAMQEHKSALASSILAAEIDQPRAGQLAFNEQDLAELFAPMGA